jgi:hypothetical protein
MVLGHLDRTQARLRANPLAYRLVIGTRILLCAGFLPTGIVKLLGRPFTIMDPATPVGLFFHALHQSGEYWQFIGAAQVVASLLLLVPALAHLGAMMFFPILVNIFVITTTMEFKGTPAVTGLMLLANLLLLAWDYHRWRGLLTTRPFSVATPEPLPLSRLERAGYVLGTVFGVTFFLGTRSLVPRFTLMPSLAGAALAIGFVLILAAQRPWRRKAAAAAGGAQPAGSGLLSQQ